MSRCSQPASCIALNVQAHARSYTRVARLSESGSLLVLEPVLDTDRAKWVRSAPGGTMEKRFSAALKLPRQD